MSSDGRVSSDSNTNSSGSSIATPSALSSEKSESERSDRSSARASTRSSSRTTRSSRSRHRSRNRSSSKAYHVVKPSGRSTVLEITIVKPRAKSVSRKTDRYTEPSARPRPKSSSPRYSEAVHKTKSSEMSRSSTRSRSGWSATRSRSKAKSSYRSKPARENKSKKTVKRSSRKSRFSTRSLSKPLSSRLVIRSRSKDKKKLRTSMKSKPESNAIRKKKSKGSATSSSRKSRSSSRSRSKSKSRTQASTRSKSNSNTKYLSQKSRRSHSKLKDPKQKSKPVRRRKIEDSTKERLRRKSATKSSFPGRKVTFDSESKKNRKCPDNAKKNKRSSKLSNSKSASASRSRSKIRAKIAAKRSSSRTASKQKRTTSSFSKPRRSLIKSKRSSKNSSKGITSSRNMNVTLVDTSNSPPRSNPRQSKGPKNDLATDLCSIDVFPGTVSMRRPSGLENVCQIKSTKVLEMNTPFVVYNTSSIEINPSNRQLLIQTAVLICDHDKTYLDVNAEAKPVIDVSTEENGKELEESRVFLTRANGMILIQRTSVVNNYWEKAEKVKTFHFQPLKFNVVRLNGSGKPSGVLQIHLMQGVRAEGGQLSRREAVVVNFGDEAFIQEESESLRKLMRENSVVKIGKEHERGFSFFEETLDREKTISVSREIGISKAIWNAGERVEKIEDIKICCGGQEIPLEKNSMTKGSSTTSVEMNPGNFQGLPPKTQTPAVIPSSTRIQLSPKQLQQLALMLANQISPPQVTPVVPSALKTPSVTPVTPEILLEQPRKEQPSILNTPTPTFTKILNKVPSTMTAKKIRQPANVQPETKSEPPIVAKPDETTRSVTDEPPKKKKVCLACKNAKAAQAKAKMTETAEKPLPPPIVAKVPSIVTAKEIPLLMKPPSQKKNTVLTSSSSSSAATSSGGSRRNRKRNAGCRSCKDAAEAQAKFKKSGASKKSVSKREEFTKVTSSKTDSSVPPIVEKIPSISSAKEIPPEKKAQPILKQSSSKSERAKERKKGASQKISEKKVASISKSLKKSSIGSMKAETKNDTNTVATKEIPAKKTPIVAVPPSAKSKKSGLTAKEKEMLLKSWTETDDLIPYTPPPKPEASQNSSTTDSQKSTSGTRSKWSARTKPLSVARKAMSQIKKQQKPKTIGKRGSRSCDELIAAEKEEKIWKEMMNEPETPPNEKASSKKATEKSEDKEKPKTPAVSAGALASALLSYVLPSQSKSTPSQPANETPVTNQLPKSPKTPSQPPKTLTQLLKSPSQHFKSPSELPKTPFQRSQKSGAIKANRGLQDCGKAHRQAQYKYRMADTMEAAAKPIVAIQPGQKVPEKIPPKNSSKKKSAILSEKIKQQKSDVKSQRSMRKVKVEKAPEVELSVEMAGNQTPPRKEASAGTPWTLKPEKTKSSRDDQNSQKTPSNSDPAKKEASSLKKSTSKKDVNPEISSSEPNESSFSESTKVSKVDSLMKYRKPRSANKKKTQESSKMEVKTPSKVDDQPKKNEPSISAVTALKAPSTSAATEKSEDKEKPKTPAVRSMLETPKKETPTPEATPLKTEAPKDTPSKTVIQPTTPKASTDSSMASSVLNFLFSRQSKPPSAEKTKENKEAPKSAPTVSEISKPRYRKPRSLKAKKTSSASLKSSLSKKTKGKSSKKRVSFKTDELPKNTEVQHSEAATKSVKQPKPEEPKTSSKSDKPISEAPTKTPSKIDAQESEKLNKTPSKTEEKKPASQLKPETNRKTKPVPAVAVKSDGPVISRLSTKPEGRIILNAPFDNAQVIPLLVINDGPRHVAWSLKTTRPSHFEANPAFGILQPGTRIHAFVGFAGFVGGEEPKKSDRLTVMWTDVEEGTTFCRELFEKDDIVTGKKLLPVEYNE